LSQELNKFISVSFFPIFGFDFFCEKIVAVNKRLNNRTKIFCKVNNPEYFFVQE